MPKEAFDVAGGDDEGWDVVGKKNKKKKGRTLHLSEFNENAQMLARSVRLDGEEEEYPRNQGGGHHANGARPHHQPTTSAPRAAPPVHHQPTTSQYIIEHICPVPEDEISDTFRQLKKEAQSQACVQHLLVENVDMQGLVAKGVKVDIMFRERFGHFGEIIHFRIFTDHEAIAISFDTLAHAAEGMKAQHGTIVEDRRLHVNPIKTFPNDKWLRMHLHNFKSYAEFCKRYKGNGRLTYNRATNTFYRPGYYITSQNETKLQRVLEVAVPQQQQEQHAVPVAPPAMPPLSQEAALAAAATTTAAADQGSEAGAGIQSRTAVAVPSCPAEPPVEAMSNLQVEAERQDVRRSPASVSVDDFASCALAKSFDTVQIVGCTARVLTEHYYKCEKFTIPSQHFRDPSRILHEERTVLALHNFDTHQLEGLWAAVSNTGHQIEWQQLRIYRALPSDEFNSLLSHLAPLPIEWESLPIKVVGAHAKRLLLAFHRHADTEDAGVGAAALAPAAQLPVPAAAAPGPPWPSMGMMQPAYMPPPGPHPPQINPYPGMGHHLRGEPHPADGFHPGAGYAPALLGARPMQPYFPPHMPPAAHVPPAHYHPGPPYQAPYIHSAALSTPNPTTHTHPTVSPPSAHINGAADHYPPTTQPSPTTASVSPPAKPDSSVQPSIEAASPTTAAKAPAAATPDTTAATPANGSAAAAAADTKRNKRLCCNADCTHPAAYINLVCKHLGPCLQCSPKPEVWAAKIGQCMVCGEKTIKAHRIIF